MVNHLIDEVSLSSHQPDRSLTPGVAAFNLECLTLSSPNDRGPYPQRIRTPFGRHQATFCWAVPSEKSGWQKDGIRGGRIILNRISGEVDLLIKDAFGTTSSVKNSGKILARNATSGLIRVNVLYDGGTTEDYVFQLDAWGDETVASTVIRCRGPR
jgi:hypothetical protein